MLREDQSDALDALNEKLTNLTVGVEDKVGIQSLFDNIDILLRAGMDLRLDQADVESTFEEWEEPTEMEAVNVLFPLYDSSGDQSSYNMSFTYAQGDDDGYIVDAEVQYEWEADDEIGFEYDEFDSI